MVGEKEFAIVIVDTETNKPMGVPVRPIDDQTTYTDGEQQPTTVNILDVGAVDLPGTAVDLDSISWSSFFPGEHDANICDVPASGLKTPEQYRNQFSSWKDNGTTLRLVWPLAALNKAMYVKSFTWNAPNAAGDIFYTVTFREVKTIAPKKVTPGGTATTAKQPADRDKSPVKQAAAAAPKPKTYTVKSGDTLTGIAKKLGLSPWKEKLYIPNKSVIGANPDKIKPGMVLKV